MIELNKVDFYYGKNKIFDELSVTLTEGKIYGLIGKNGAGKTTLLKIIAGLLFPKAGSATVWGVKSSERRPSILTDIFFIPESFCLPQITGELYVKTTAGFYPSFSEKIFLDKLKEFEIDKNVRLDKLSYGQKKKFMLSFGFASGARVLIFDEPTNGLDIPSQKSIRKILAQFISDDKTVIISTHHFKELENIFDEVLILDDGKMLLKAGVCGITEKFTVKLLSSIDEVPDDIIYYEKVPGGYSALCTNKNNDTPADIEYILTAILSGDKKIISYINANGVENE